MNCGCKIVEMPMMASSQGGEYVARHIEYCPLHAAAEEAVKLLADLRDAEACSYDRHGYCQAHGWLNDGTCPQWRLKLLIDRLAAQGKP
jgi:hypothetical protein